MYGTRENLGLIPRICKALLSKLAELSQQEDLFPSATLSVCEIYCEQVRDLLASDAPVDAEGKQEADKKALKVRERRMMMANGGDDVETYVPGAPLDAFATGSNICPLACCLSLHGVLFLNAGCER